eukprot:1778672-Pyramimonas_sp.AAC.1
MAGVSGGPPLGARQTDWFGFRPATPRARLLQRPRHPRLCQRIRTDQARRYAAGCASRRLPCEAAQIVSRVARAR